MRQEDLNFQLGAAEQEVEACRQTLMAVVSHAAELRNQLVQAEEAGLAMERQAARIEAEKSRKEAEHSRLAAELEATSRNTSATPARWRNWRSPWLKPRSELDGREARKCLYAPRWKRLRREYSGSMARKEALEQSLARHAYSTESVRRLLSGEIPAEGHASSSPWDCLPISWKFPRATRKWWKNS